MLSNRDRQQLRDTAVLRPDLLTGLARQETSAVVPTLEVVH